MAVLIEFLGLPGVGKSAVSRHVAEQLRTGGHVVHQPSHALAHELGPAVRRLRKAAHMLRELLLHPVAACRALRIVWSSHQRSRWSGLLLFGNWMLVMDLARQARHGGGVCLFDQGLLQAVWSVGLDGDVEPALRLLASAAEQGVLPQMVVVLEAELVSVQQRLWARSSRDSRVERDPERMSELLVRGESLLNRVRGAVEGFGRTRFVVLGNGEHADLQRVSAQLAEELALPSVAAHTQPG